MNRCVVEVEKSWDSQLGSLQGKFKSWIKQKINQNLWKESVSNELLYFSNLGTLGGKLKVRKENYLYFYLIIESS